MFKICEKIKPELILGKQIYKEHNNAMAPSSPPPPFSTLWSGHTVQNYQFSGNYGTVTTHLRIK